MLKQLLRLTAVGTAWWFSFGLPQISAQILSVDPVFPTVEDTVSIVYDATQGNAALVGVSPIYAHTGVITDQSTSGTDWKYVKADWTTNLAEARLQDLGNNLHEISYHIRSYYGIPSNEKVEKLAFVFRNSDGSKVGRDPNGADIFYNVYDGSVLEVAFLNLENKLILSLGDSLSIKAAASASGIFSLKANQTLLTQVSGKSIDYTWTPTQAGSYTLKIEATANGDTRSDSVQVLVRGPVLVQDPPANWKPGINYLADTAVALMLYAPEKTFAFVLGDFNDWQANEAGYMNLSSDSSHFWVQINGLIPGEEYAFQYFVDGSIHVADPYAEKVLDPWHDPFINAQRYPNLKPYPSGKANGIVSVFQTGQTPYVWQTQAWTRPQASQLVIYELLLRDYLANNTYQTLIDTLPYLQRLGVNAIELMPITEFEGNLSWGYNPSFMLAPDKYYGPSDQLKAFIDSCHAQGIAVILDMVLNHQFGQSPLVQLYWDAANNRPAANSPYFNVEATHPFNVGYDFNHESPATQAFSDRVLAHWLTEYRFDGFRMDLSKGFTQRDANGDVGAWSQYDGGRIALLKRMFDQMRLADPSAYFILEHFADNGEEKELAEYGMLTWGNANYNYNEATMGYLSGSNFEWVSYQQRGWAEPHLVGYMESHDEERLMYKNLSFGNSSGNYDIKDLQTALRRNEMAACFFFPIPGPKLLWQFGELGYGVSIDFNGRLGEKPIRWYYFNDPDRRRLFEVYRALIDLKLTYPVFQTTNFSLNANGAVKRLHLNDNSMNVTILGNFDVNVQSAAPNFQHSGWWYDFFTGDSLMVNNPNAQMSFAPGEYHLYTDVRLTTPNISVGLPDPFSIDPPLILYPNPSQGQLSLELQLNQSGPYQILLFSAQGQLIRTLQEGMTTRPGRESLNLDLAGIPAGMYLLTVQTDGKQFSQKLSLLPRP